MKNPTVEIHLEVPGNEPETVRVKLPDGKNHYDSLEARFGAFLSLLYSQPVAIVIPKSPKLRAAGIPIARIIFVGLVEDE